MIPTGVALFFAFMMLWIGVSFGMLIEMARRHRHDERGRACRKQEADFEQRMNEIERRLREEGRLAVAGLGAQLRDGSMQNLGHDGVRHALERLSKTVDYIAEQVYAHRTITEVEEEGDPDGDDPLEEDGPDLKLVS